MADTILEKLIREEEKRQKTTINLIPSENYVSPEMLSVLGSVLTNKYSEGYPGKRYYPGNKIYDQIENLAIQRLKSIFKLGADWHVNVQPYSGSPANLAIYYSLLQPGETLMGMSLAAGGHLTHGHKVNFSGRIFKSIQYGVNLDTGLIDYDEVERLSEEHQPKVIISGATAYPRTIDFARFGKIAKKAGVFHVADISHIAGLIAAGEHPSPFDPSTSSGEPHADVVMTTTHKTLRGPRGAVIFCRKEFADRIDRSVFPGLQGGPHNNVIAAIALMAFEAGKPAFKAYQKQIVKNAKKLAESLIKRGFKLVTGGTDNHLMLLDCKSVNLDGLNPVRNLARASAPEGPSGRAISNGMKAQNLLEEAGINANRNSIPGDVSPFYPTGLRLGTPAVTTRGMKEKDMEKIAEWFERVLIKKEKPAQVKKEVLRNYG